MAKRHKNDPEWKRGFEAGYLCAIATLVKQHDAMVEAVDLLSQLGSNVDIRNVDLFDRPEIRKVLQYLKSRERYKRSLR